MSLPIAVGLILIMYPVLAKAVFQVFAYAAQGYLYLRCCPGGWGWNSRLSWPVKTGRSEPERP